MKTITIIGAYSSKSSVNLINRNKADFIIEGDEETSVFDGYHTIEELYDHRITLFIALARERDARFTQEVWRSKINGDGSVWDGWFVMGIGRAPGDQITYHLPLSRWDETNFADTLDKAPDFDGHTSQDVLERLKKL